MATKISQFVNYLQEQNKHYFSTIEGKPSLIYRTGGDNVSDINVHVHLPEDKSNARLYIFSFCKFPAEKSAAMYKVANEINFQYIGLTCYVDDSDNTITIQNAFPVGFPGWENELYMEIKSLSKAADDIYPQLMQAIWS